MATEWNFNILTTGDLQLGLEDLFESHMKHVAHSEIGEAYLTKLGPLVKAIQDLPPAFRRQRPLTEELLRTDRLHHALGGSIFTFTEAILRNPRASDEFKGTVTKIRDTFIPSLRDLQTNYADEACMARKRREDLPTYKATLTAIPVPGGRTEKATLLDWFDDFLDQGVKVDDLLNERASILAKGNEITQQRARDLRLKTIRLLNRFRKSLADEIEDADSIPANLDALIFGYFDEMCAMRPGFTPSGGMKPPEGDAQPQSDSPPPT